MGIRVRSILLTFAMIAALGLARSASATVVNLQAAGVMGTGSYFASAGNAETVSITAGGYTIVLTGGTPLGPGISNLPATDSIAYGTNNNFTGAAGETGYTNPITIQFFEAGTTTPEDVTNFFLNLYNGNTVNVDYTLEDNLGNGEIFNVGSNLLSGQQTFGFASAGNSFTITAGPATDGIWDFFVDNIGFNQALPPGSTNGGMPIGATPEPSSWGLMLIGFGALLFVAYRRATRSIAAQAQ